MKKNDHTDEILVISVYFLVYGFSKIILIPSLEEARKGLSILSDFVLFFGSSFLILKNTVQQKRWFVYLIVSIVYSVTSFALKYQEEGIICLGEPIKSYLTTLYFSVVTITTLGYGDCYPTESARLYAASQAIFGVIMFGTMVSILLHIFKNKQKNVK